MAYGWTYIKVKGQWTYLYRAIDKYGNTVDFMLSKQRDEAAAKAFFQQAIEDNGLPGKVVIDKSGANNAGLENMGVSDFLCKWPLKNEIDKSQSHSVQSIKINP